MEMPGRIRDSMRRKFGGCMISVRLITFELDSDDEGIRLLLENVPYIFHASDVVMLCSVVGKRSRFMDEDWKWSNLETRHTPKSRKAQ